MFKTFLSVIYLLTSVAIFFVWSKPFYNDKDTGIQALKSTLAGFNEQLNNSSEVKGLRDKLIEDLNSISEEDMSRLNAMLPSKADQIGFVLELEKLGVKNTVSLKDIVMEEKRDEKTENAGGARKKSKTVQNFTAIPISVRVSGSYVSLMHFLDDLEKSLRLVEIKGLDFTATDSGVYEFSLKLEIYQKNA